MAVPVRHKDILTGYIANPSNPVWARDLVCLAISTGGVLSDDDILLVWQECESNTTVQSQTIPAGFGSPYSKVEVTKLKHVSGVNMLAPNQEIVFCDEGVTLLYGQNRSGKSGYFRILNQLSKGEVQYPILTNVYSSTTTPIEIFLEYRLNGVNQTPFCWNGVSTTPGELRHIRCFDSKYASMFLTPREGNSYFYESYSLRIFRAIHETLLYLKNEMGASIDPGAESSLTSLCTTSYKDVLSHALIDEFRRELGALGMRNLQVSLDIDDLLTEHPQIKVSLSNGMRIDTVLSEAELKCVALALFFAECELMEVKQPIIFDDPVNSLDASIIQYFSDKIRDLGSEVIVFTHNVLLMEALTDSRQFKVYYNPVASRSGTGKKHVLMYDVLTNNQYVGYIVEGGSKKTLFYLDKAQTQLSSTGPVGDINSIVADLRLAAEWAIDEVVFRGLAPRRFKGSEITDWISMMSMASAGDASVREIKRIYDQLSGMGTHLGYSSYAIIPTPSALQTIHDDLMTVFRTVYP
ncbi:MAG: hypothetical protein KBT27_04700 [Prevotellaceae bacterium]|nr:hypothetical protein [Candidatus Faecinaster equi]